MSVSGFERYFHARADVADCLVEKGHALEGCGLATAAIDALGAIWCLDFEAARTELTRRCGGKIAAATRMSSFVETFVPDDDLARRVAVVSFAEDWKRHASTTSGPADELLARRRGTIEGQLPDPADDKTVDELLVECPEIGANSNLRAAVEEYRYPALLYRFYRCPTLHMFGWARRTHRYSTDEDVMYIRLHLHSSTSISFGPALMTRWLRTAATNYVRACADAKIEPASDLDPGAQSEDQLRNKLRRPREVVRLCS